MPWSFPGSSWPTFRGPPGPSAGPPEDADAAYGFLGFGYFHLLEEVDALRSGAQFPGRSSACSLRTFISRSKSIMRDSLSGRVKPEGDEKRS
jgi:hypothetical protein